MIVVLQYMQTVNMADSEPKTVWSVPLFHKCGCTMLWSVKETPNDVFWLKTIFREMCKYPCPFHGASTGTIPEVPDDGTRILLENATRPLWYTRTHDKKDEEDGKRNAYAAGLARNSRSASLSKQLKNKINELEKHRTRQQR